MNALDILGGNSIFSELLRSNVNDLTGGLLGTGEMQKRANETEKQHKDRILKAVAAGIIASKETARSIKGVETNDLKASLISGAIYQTITEKLSFVLSIVLIPVSLFVLSKKSKK